jgi:hypothetical protein
VLKGRGSKVIVTFTFTGTLSNGTDNSGVFGPAGGNLTGDPFSLSLSVDDTKGSPNDVITGETGIVTGPEANGVVAAVTISAKTYTYPSVGESQIDRSVAGPNAALVFGFSSPDGDPTSAINIAIETGADNAPYLSTDNWEAPFSTYTLVPEFGASGDSVMEANFSLDTGGMASGNLKIQTVTETTTAVPPPPVEVTLHGSSSQYLIADDNGSLYVQDTMAGRDGTQTLSGVNEMMFTDGVGVFDPTGTAEDVARLYKAALDRPPDVAGLGSWTSAIDDSNVPLLSVANSFTTSPEFIQDFGSLSDAAFVNQLYLQVLGRPADAAGAQAWDSALGSGLSRGAVLVDFAESQEYEGDTISTAGDPNNAEVFRVYNAALGRAPDAGGQAAWSSFLANGGTPTQIAQGLVSSPEFMQDFGSLNDSDFVSLSYKNVLHRAADAAGAMSWTNALQQGDSRASVVVGFADSTENRALTAGATHANWVFIPA